MSRWHYAAKHIDISVMWRHLLYFLICWSRSDNRSWIKCWTVEHPNKNLSFHQSSWYSQSRLARAELPASASNVCTFTLPLCMGTYALYLQHYQQQWGRSLSKAWKPWGLGRTGATWCFHLLCMLPCYATCCCSYPSLLFPVGCMCAITNCSNYLFKWIWKVNTVTVQHTYLTSLAAVRKKLSRGLIPLLLCYMLLFPGLSVLACCLCANQLL